MLSSGANFASQGRRHVDDMDKYVGRRIKVRRVLMGLSQESLARRLNVTFQQVQKYETGTNRVSASKLFEIAHALSVPITYFFAGAPIGNGSAEHTSKSFVAEDFLSSREGVELNRAFLRLQDPRARHTIISLVRALAH